MGVIPVRSATVRVLLARSTPRSALRTAAPALQQSGYVARRSGRLVILTLDTKNCLPVGVQGVPVESSPVATESDGADAPDGGLSMKIEGPRFAVSRVVALLERRRLA
jgi:hypothetical protein